MHGAIGRFTAKTNKTGLALFPERQMVNHNVLTIPQNCIKRTCIDSILLSNTLSGHWSSCSPVQPRIRVLCFSLADFLTEAAAKEIFSILTNYFFLWLVQFIFNFADLVALRWQWSPWMELYWTPQPRHSSSPWVRVGRDFGGKNYQISLINKSWLQIQWWWYKMTLVNLTISPFL